MSDMVRVYIEDHGPLGPAAYPVQLASLYAPLDGAVVEVPVEQAKRWEAAETAWLKAQAEMRPILGARRDQFVAAIGRASSYEAGNRAAARERRGRR